MEHGKKERKKKKAYDYNYALLRKANCLGKKYVNLNWIVDHLAKMYLCASIVGPNLVVAFLRLAVLLGQSARVYQSAKVC